MGLFITLSAASSRWTSTVVQGSASLSLHSLLRAVCLVQESPFNPVRVAVCPEPGGSVLLVVLVYTRLRMGGLLLVRGLSIYQEKKKENKPSLLKE